jgi:hypothetical protein
MSAGFVDDHAMILYVYLDNYDNGGDDSVLTVSSCHSLLREIALTLSSIISRHSVLEIMCNLLSLWASQPVNWVANMPHLVLENYVHASFFNYVDRVFCFLLYPVFLSNLLCITGWHSISTCVTLLVKY